MGKQRRQRQQYHIQAVNSKKSEKVIENTAQDNSVANTTSMNISLESNPFANMSIDTGSIKKTLHEYKDDDVRSVKSFKSVKSEIGGGSGIKKKDKIKMRRVLLMKKLEKLKKVKAVKKGRHELMGDTKSLLDALDFVTVKDCVKGEEVLTKTRPIQKADKRKKDFAKGVTIYQKIMKNSQFLKNPMDAIKDHVAAVVEAEKNKIVKKK
ncbi:PREDICTED: uncharacterized protein LOC108559983 [Nicrophorus vespilloides]|uniref:Uncharacterized protein LOC108559983 n=1 Tax=Nicrophorus vespilloides TaxID=110193 RepID=A0ABM1ME75_NICVS|nr:PREDICTED: uncharacterized protein LOC108559983 [Nicrophorus vespilloides]